MTVNMLSEKELDQTAAKLADFRTASEQHHATLTEVLEKYTTLMDDYKRLRSDYEEERDSRERYKQMARGQERNPFVLVLIDGDRYVFDDDLISGGPEGGQRAAQLLNDAVKAASVAVDRTTTGSWSECTPTSLACPKLCRKSN